MDKKSSKAESRGQFVADIEQILAKEEEHADDMKTLIEAISQGEEKPRPPQPVKAAS